MVDGLAAYKKHSPATSKEYQENYQKIFGKQDKDGNYGEQVFENFERTATGVKWTTRMNSLGDNFTKKKSVDLHKK